MKKRYLQAGGGAVLIGLVLFASFAPAQDMPTGSKSAGQTQVISLNLASAVDYALRNNLQRHLALERINEAKGRYTQTASYMFPHLGFESTEERTFHKNLAAEGFSSAGVIGPYNTFDAHLQLTQRIFDLSAIQRLNAGGAALKIAGFENDLARQQVTLTAAMAYLRLLQIRQERIAVEESLRLAEDLLSITGHQKKAGLATAIDVARARTHAVGQKARLAQMTYNEDQAAFHLKRITGVPLEAALDLTDTLFFNPQEPLLVQEALETARADRIEMKIAAARVGYRVHQLGVAKDQRYPSVDLSGEYGYTGESPRKMMEETGSVEIAFHLPVFEGGRIKGEIAEQDSRMRQEELVKNDLEKQIEEDVHLAIRSLKSSAAEVDAAKELIDLAQQEMQMARRRFQSGIGDHIEVVSAQSSWEEAQQTYVAALVQYQISRMNFYSSIGRIEEFQLQDSVIGKQR